MADASVARTVDVRVAAALGGLGLVRPLLSIAGAFEDGSPFAAPAGPLVATALVSVAWVAVAVARRVARPVRTLAAAGLVYAGLAAALNLLLQPVLDSAERIPLPGLVAMVVWNLMCGAALGCVAALILRRR